MGLSRKLITIGVLFLATLATGFWRGNAGSPAFPGLLHKLLGLAWVIYTAIVVYHAGRPVESRAAFFSAIAVLALSMVALIATGSLLTMPQHENAAWLHAHRIASAIAAIAGGVTVRLLMLNGQ
jgi:hypothetical protein